MSEPVRKKMYGVLYAISKPRHKVPEEAAGVWPEWPDHHTSSGISAFL